MTVLCDEPNHGHIQAENDRLREAMRQLIAVVKKYGEDAAWVASYAEDVLENRRLA